MINHDSQASLIEKPPASFDEASVDQVQVFERNNTGEERQHPGKANNAEVHPQLDEELVKVVHVDSEVFPNPVDVLITLLES